MSLYLPPLNAWKTFTRAVAGVLAGFAASCIHYWLNGDFKVMFWAYLSLCGGAASVVATMINLQDVVDENREPPSWSLASRSA